ncbi:hypothetical protein [Leeuwenhoekiella sp. H156]
MKSPIAIFSLALRIVVKIPHGAFFAGGIETESLPLPAGRPDPRPAGSG